MAISEELLIFIQARLKGKEKIDEARKSVQRLTSGMGGLQKSFFLIRKQGQMMVSQFQAWALSVLFFGMAIQRTFSRIAKTSVQAFTKIMDASDLTSGNIARLSAWWEFLKFSIGSAINTALGPLLPAIISIISAVVDWIQRNPELTAGIIGFMIALGALLLVVGTLVLGFTGLAAAISFLTSPIGLIILGILALVALFVLLWTQSETFRNIVTGVFNAIAAVVGFLWTIFKFNFTLMWTIIQIIIEIVRIFWETLIAIVVWLLDTFFPGWREVWTKVKDFVGGIVDSILGFLQTIIDKAKEVLELLKKVSGANIVSGVVGTVSDVIGGRQFGGPVQQTGLFRLHPGETVVPSGGNNFGNISVTVNTAATDAKSISREIGKEIMNEIRRFGGSRAFAGA